MAWLVVSWFLTFGMVPEQYETVHVYDEKGNLYSTSFEIGNIAYFSDLGFEALIVDHIKLSGSVKTYATYDRTIWYNPYRSDYSFGASVYVNKSLELGMNHICDHIVKSHLRADGYSSYQTEFFVKMSGETTF